MILGPSQLRIQREEQINHPWLDDVQAYTWWSGDKPSERTARSILDPEAEHLTIVSDRQAIGILQWKDEGTTSEVKLFLAPNPKGHLIGVDLIDFFSRWLFDLGVHRVEVTIDLQHIAELIVFSRANFFRSSPVMEYDLEQEEPVFTGAVTLTRLNPEFTHGDGF